MNSINGNTEVVDINLQVPAYNLVSTRALAQQAIENVAKQDIITPLIEIFIAFEFITYFTTFISWVLCIALTPT